MNQCRACIDGIEENQTKSGAGHHVEADPRAPLWTDHHLSTGPTRREERGNWGKDKECSRGRPAHCEDDRAA